MHTLSVNVTDFSRGLSDYLNHVQYRGQVLDIERGKRVVARVSPVDFSDGFPLAQLDEFSAWPGVDAEGAPVYGQPRARCACQAHRAG